MRRDFISLAESDSLGEVCGLMRMARVRHLPVLRDGRLLGVVSYRELLESALAELESRLPPAARDELRARPIAPLVHERVLSVASGSPPERVAEPMLRHHVGFVPVVDEDRLIAIVTEADLLRAAYASSAD